MSAVIVIPARYASTRYPGKPLVPLRGPDGAAKTLIERSWEAAQAVRGIDRVVVATDDDRIAAACADFGAEVVMTPESCANGTERCAAALPGLGTAPEIIVNLQGDAPLTPPWFIEDLVAGLRDTPAAGVATPVLTCDGSTLEALRNDRQHGRVGGTTAVFDRSSRALYFSKEVVPYTSAAYAPDADTPVWHHVGAYAYRRAALESYARLQPGALETLEGLEQLRFLENGIPILCVPVEARGRVFWELNNPTDVARIEDALRHLKV